MSGDATIQTVLGPARAGRAELGGALARIAASVRRLVGAVPSWREDGLQASLPLGLSAWCSCLQRPAGQAN